MERLRHGGHHHLRGAECDSSGQTEGPCRQDVRRGGTHHQPFTGKTGTTLTGLTRSYTTDGYTSYAAYAHNSGKSVLVGLARLTFSRPRKSLHCCGEMHLLYRAIHRARHSWCDLLYTWG